MSVPDSNNIFALHQRRQMQQKTKNDKTEIMSITSGETRRVMVVGGRGLKSKSRGRQ